MQYNWAFVIIAGAVILAFFVSFTVKYIDIQNKKDSAMVASEIYNSLFALQKSSYQTETPIDLFLRTDLSFSCDKLEVGNFFSEALEKEFVFAPRSLFTDKIQVFMKSWKYPFKIANLFYLTSSEKKYYIIFDASSAEFVNSLEFPKNFNIIKTTTKPNLNDPNSRIISFTSQNADVKITPGENGYATINNKQYPVLGLPLVYGAIFSSDYPCILDRLLAKFSNMIDIYSAKVDYMSALNNNCDYSQLKRTLSLLNERIKSKDYVSINEYSRTLEEQNNNLLNSECQPLY